MRRYMYRLEIEYEEEGGIRPDYFDNLKTVPQVHYLRDKFFEVDFGRQKLYISNVKSILILTIEEEIEKEVPVVKIAKP